MTEYPNLRPMTLAELLDQGIRIYRRNFLKFLGIMALVQIPLSVLTILANSATMAGSLSNDYSETAALASLAGSCLTVILGTVQGILIQGFASATIVRSVADQYLGKRFGILDSYKRIGQKWLWIIVGYVLLILASIVIGIWTIIPLAGWFTGPGMLAFLGLVVWQFLLPVIVLEDQDVIASVRRAWEISRLRFWWMVGFAAVLTIISTILITLPVYVISFGLFGVLASASSSLSTQIISTVIASVVGIIASLLYTPFQLSLVTTVYIDLRVRFEAFDLAIKTSGEGDDSKDVFASATPAPPAEKLITGTELGYFAILSLAGVALYFILVMIFMAVAFLALSPGIL